MKSQLKNNLKKIKNNINKFTSENQQVTLIAVSKTQPIEKINEAMGCKIINFGENKVQEAEKKFKNKPKAVKLHLIGHLQSNKAKRAINLFDTIQTIDTLKLAEKVNDLSKKINKTQKIFCQINIGNDPQKKGFKKAPFLKIIEKIFLLKHLKVDGLMTILPRGLNEKEIKQLYQKMKTLKTNIDKKYNTQLELSMGMSDDYIIAIKQGATMIRVGTQLFGKRA